MAGGHPSDEERARAALPVLEALLDAARRDDAEALGACYDEAIAWLDVDGAAIGRAEAVPRHRALAARAGEWAPPQQQGAKAVLRWLERGPDGKVAARGALVVEVRRGRVIFAASVW